MPEPSPCDWIECVEAWLDKAGGEYDHRSWMDTLKRAGGKGVSAVEIVGGEPFFVIGRAKG